MPEWRDATKKRCPVHDLPMIVDKNTVERDGQPVRVNGKVRVKCPFATCDETALIPEADARADID